MGLEEIEDSWEPLESLSSTIPNSVEIFVRDLAKKGREDAKIALDTISTPTSPELNLRIIRPIPKQTLLEKCWQGLRNSQISSRQEQNDFIHIAYTRWSEFQDRNLVAWKKYRAEGRRPKALGWYDEIELSKRALDLKRFPKPSYKGIVPIEQCSKKTLAIPEQTRFELAEAFVDQIVLQSKSSSNFKIEKDDRENVFMHWKTNKKEILFKIEKIPYAFYPWPTKWTKSTWQYVNDYIQKYFGTKTRVTFLVTAG